jgi:uncharacterized membrane protein YfcA
MSVEQAALLATIFLVVAAVYSTVGHAGASGYLAVMALVGVAPGVMRPVALALNIVVAAIASVRFAQAGYFNARALVPFLIGSIPFAALGGAWRIGGSAYRVLLGCVLLVSAGILAWRALNAAQLLATESRPITRIPIAAAVAIGAGIGLLSGLTGTGGGIFLSPLLLLAHWANARQTAGISAPFILCNSTAGLLAGTLTWASVPPQLPWLAVAVIAGGLLGSWLGTRRLAPPALLGTLAVVLVLAAGKLLLTHA